MNRRACQYKSFKMPAWVCMCADLFRRKRADDCPNVRCSSTLIYPNSGVGEGVLTVLTNIRPSSTLIYPDSGVDEGVLRCFYLLDIIDSLSPSTNYS